MKNWQEDLLAVLDAEPSEAIAFEGIERAARALGFEYVAYGMRMPLPLTRPRTLMVNNYPGAWRTHYEREGYLAIDPTVRHGARSQAPIVWSRELFAASPRLWDDAQSAGLRVGWAKSTLDRHGGGMLSLARDREPLEEAELRAKELRLRWLANVAHLALSRVLARQEAVEDRPALTAREIEVLRWTAEGKTSGDISCILNVSVDTINFHIKNAVEKLGSPNRTAAAVRAAMLGILN
jgi:LuxR family transcriptional regulator